MMKTLLALALVFCQLSSSQAAEKRCVLIFERPESPITKFVVKTFTKASGLKLKVLAQPLDIVDCVRDDSNEIVLIIHALERKGSDIVSLAYFREYTQAEAVSLYQVAVQKLQDKIQKSRDEGEKERLRRKLRDQIRIDLRRTYYETLPVLPRVFALMRLELQKKAREGFVPLRRIRLMVCQSQKVMEHYTDFSDLLKEHEIELDVAPKNKLMSFFAGKPVTSPSKKWLEKSLTLSPEKR